MKIAVVLAAPWIPGSVDMTLYLRHLQSLGHDALMICLDRSQGPDEFDVQPADQATLEDPTFYKRLQLDAAIAFCWFHNPKILSALKQAGVRVLLRADSDGMISLRQFPSHHARVRMSGEQGLLNRAKAAKHLVQRYLFDCKTEDNATLGSLQSADITVMETAQAAKNISGFLDRQKHGELKNRISIVPHFVADAFLQAEVRQQRDNAVVSIGRWEDPQKNAPLLAKTIERHLVKKPATRFSIIGSETGRAEFESLIKKHPQVTYTGPQNATGVRQYLSNARVLLSASRWEGSPVVANEALAMGCTIVGTPIAAFIDLGSARAFGTVASSHTPADLADALFDELHAWDANQRNPQAIANAWRPRLSSKVVVSQLVELLTTATILRPV